MEKVKKREMFIFSYGDAFSVGYQTLLSFFYLVFLTEVASIKPFIAGGIIFIGKLFSAFLDPLFGYISDHTKSKYGRRRIYFLYGSFLVTLSFWMLFWKFDINSSTIRSLIALFAMLFFTLSQAVISVPYNAMISEITTDNKERLLITAIRLFYSQIAIIICIMTPLLIINRFSSVEVGWSIMGIIFACFFGLPFLLLFFFTKERTHEPILDSKYSLKEFFKPFKIRGYTYLLLMYIISSLALDLMSTTFLYYFNYYLEKPELFNLVAGSLIIFQMVFIPLVVRTARIRGKNFVFKVGNLIWIAGMIWFIFYNRDMANIIIFIIAAFLGAGMCSTNSMIWMMITDISDSSIEQFGERLSGSISGVMTFSKKIISGLGILIVGLFLDLAGFVEPIDNVLQHQNDNVLKVILCFIIFIPATLSIISLLFSFKYKHKADLSKIFDK